GILDGVSWNYFGPVGVARQQLLWALATRRQLDRWEALVARSVCAGLGWGPSLTSEAIWQAATEHHFALIAAHHMMRSIALPGSRIALPQALAHDIRDGRDMHEHWEENMPVFNVTPRAQQPRYKSGQSFASRNPADSPYDWLRWSSRCGPCLLPNVPAHE